MSSLESRIKRAERFAAVEERELPALIIRLPDDDTVPHFAEPVSQWVTVQRAIEQARQERVPCVVIADPQAEHQARQERVSP